IVKIDNTPFENGIAIYPQPIALSCGQICRARNSQEQLDAILKCAETVTRYLAVVTISSFSARDDANVAIPNGLSNFTGNLSFGHFLSVVQGITTVNCSYPLKDALVAAFKGKKGSSESANARLTKLLNLRNQLSHDLRSSSEAKATSIFKEQAPDEDLKVALGALDSIFRLPLFVVEEQRVESKKIIARRLLLIRVSRYFGHLLRRKNATGWAHGKGEPTSIGQARRHLIDLFTQDGQISIEDAVVE